MAGTTEPAADFDAYLAQRGISPADYQAMPEEMRQYFRETWQWESHIIAPLPADRERPPEAPPAYAAVADSQEARPASGLSPASVPAGNLLPWVTLACGLLLVALLYLQMRPHTEPGAGPSTGPPVAAHPAPAVPAPTDAAPALPETAVSGPSWQVVGRAEQTASMTIPFTIHGPKWRIVWMTRPASSAASGFALTLVKPDGRTQDPVTRVVGEGEGEMVLRGKGRFTLKVASGQRYRVNVYDFR